MNPVLYSLGRFPIVVPFQNLTEEYLVRILSEPEESLLGQFKTLFELDKVEFLNPIFIN